MAKDSAQPLPPGLDAVEIKVTFGAEQVDAALAAFDLRPEAAERRRIWFCEQVEGYGGPARLPLLARGLILRVRSKERGGHDTTVKLRGPEGCVDSDRWRQRTKKHGKKARIEGDWVGQRHLVSASLDGEVDGGLIDKAVARPRHVPRLFAAQKGLARDWLLPLGQLDLLGPVAAMRWDPAEGGTAEGGTAEGGPAERVVAELWEVGDLRFLELSVRVTEGPADAQQRLEGSARGRGLLVSPAQETKTRLVLEHLAVAAAPR